MAREWSQPVARSYDADVLVRLDARAPGVVIDRVLGAAGPEVAGDHLVGVPAFRPSAALDGDPATAWVPPFSVAQPAVTVTAPAPTTITRLAPLLLDDDRFSVATRLAIEVDGRPAGSVAVPPGGGEVALPAPLTGTTFRFVVAATEAARTTEWYGGGVVDVPVAIAELGVPELAVEVPAVLDTGCRSDLLDVDGSPVPVRARAGTAELLGGAGIAAEPCGGSLDLDRGRHSVLTADGPRTGLTVDQLVLRSGFDGVAGGDIDVPAPAVRVLDDRRWELDVGVEGATPGEPFWLVLGQSHSDGWELGGARPVLVDGFANGWLVDPSEPDATLHLTWAPQRTVGRALAVSAAGVLACVVVAAVGWWRDRRRPPAGAGAEPSPAREATPRWRVLVAVVATLGTGLAIGPLAALAVGAVAALALWGPLPVRRLLWLAPVAAYLAAAGYVLLKQAWKAPGAAFEWPAEQAAAHQPALVALALTAVLVAAGSRTPPAPGGGRAAP
jgi:hypothetical protein